MASPAEKTSLWKDADTQRICAKHWAMFARRYKGIPNERLSFNLMNEPAGVKAAVYVAVVRKLVEAIRGGRSRSADHLGWPGMGHHPRARIARLRLAQATRGYSPFELTHYKANWVDATNFPPPLWPRPFLPMAC